MASFRCNLPYLLKNYADINIFSFQLMELHMNIVLPMEEVNQYKILGPYEIKQMLQSAEQTWFTSVSIKIVTIIVEYNVYISLKQSQLAKYPIIAGPYNMENVHWCCFAADFKKRIFIMYDPMEPEKTFPNEFNFFW